MRKKIKLFSIISVFILVVVSFTSVIGLNIETIEKKESPLFKIRTRRAIGDRLKDLIEHIKVRFFGERIFFLPFQWIIRNIKNKNLDTGSYDTCCGNTKCIITCSPDCKSVACK